ncbi:hypothetical protein LMF89_15065 [Pelosinus sp. Bkl1]|uniref:Alanine dehydrogenase/pyridine nucleotide transhydrogenase N-terminal domain-containing protein n=1 Tax=Pelosinus baikalensis TaxID=2892015 RepID=A0ABS8HWZ4_9FIRM|nr:hypothetical protein [Pelosinus baikalensis]
MGGRYRAAFKLLLKNNENRVGLTLAGVDALSKAGHNVLVEENPGICVYVSRYE